MLQIKDAELSEVNQKCKIYEQIVENLQKESTELKQNLLAKSQEL